MKGPYERILERIAGRICKVCAFRGADGECYSPDPEGCAIMRKLDDIIAAVQGIHSDRMDPYVDRLRELVCANCSNQDSRGNCPLRPGANCALDDYFELVVEIIEEELSVGTSISQAAP